MAVSKLYFSVLLIFSILGVSLAQFGGLEYVSPVYRVSPYGECGIGTNYRSDAPCFQNAANPVYSFYNVTTTGRSIKSIVVTTPSSTVSYFYLGMDNNQIWVIGRNGTGYFYMQTAQPPSGSNWEFAFTDAANTYVAFVSRAGGGGTTVAKYLITANGTLQVPPTVGTIASVNTVNSVIYREPNVWLAGSSNIAQVNMDTVTVTSSTDVSTVITSNLGAIQCGAASIQSATPQVLYSTDSGVVFSFSTQSSTVDPTYAQVNGETFSTACGAKGTSYGVFYANSGKLYQFNFPSGTSGVTSPKFVVENVAVGKSIQDALTNSDETAIYFFTYTASGSAPDTIYEFALGPTVFDFSSVVQPTSPGQDPYYRNVFATYRTGTTIYIGTSASAVPRIYAFNIPSTITANSNVSSLLYADFSYTENPIGPNGKANSIADVGQTAGNGDLIFGCGLAKVNVPSNSTLSIPPRGPIITYLRGTRSVAPNHGGAANTDGPLNLRLVSMDEVSTPAVFTNGTELNLIRRMPFYSSDVAPWYRKTLIRPDGVTTTGYSWEIGVTDNLNDAAHQYSYLVPPMPSIVNNSVSTPKTRIADQYTQGYVSFLLTEEVFLQNTSMVPVNNFTYNVTTRTFRYQFTIDSWQFLSSANYLRLNLVVGVGPDGNSTISVTPGDANATESNPLLTAYIISADSADWTLVMPQNLVQDTSFVNAPQPCVYDPSRNLITIYFPYSNDPTTGKSRNQTYTLLMEYTYISPPPPEPSIQDGGGPHLLPLWIVLGVLGGIVIIGIIVAIIVIFVVYRLVWKNKTEYEIRSTFDKTENALDRDRGF